MKKLFTSIVLLAVIILGLTPPIPTVIPMTESKLWMWLVLLAGFFGCYVLFLKVNVFIKLFVAYGFINTFFSNVPFFSQFAYMELVACVYLYWMCSKVERWDLICKAFIILLVLNGILLVMQVFNKDNLLNFSLQQNTCHGIVGNSMQLKSFFIIGMAFIIAHKKFKFLKRYSIEVIVSTIVLGLFYVFHSRVIHYFLYARGPVWLRTIQLSLKHLFAGYGIGTYKILFPALCGRQAFTAEGTWMNAHNFWVQLYFEMGAIGLFIVMAGMIYIIYKVIKNKMWHSLTGLVLVNYSLMVHFPERQISTVPLLIVFFAYIQKEIEYEQFAR